MKLDFFFLKCPTKVCDKLDRNKYKKKKLSKLYYKMKLIKKWNIKRNNVDNLSRKRTLFISSCNPTTSSRIKK